MRWRRPSDASILTASPAQAKAPQGRYDHADRAHPRPSPDDQGERAAQGHPQSPAAPGPLAGRLATLGRQGLRDRPAGGPGRKPRASDRSFVAVRREGPRRSLDLGRSAAARAYDERTQQRGDAGNLQSSVSVGQPDGASHLRRLRRHLGSRGSVGDDRPRQSQSAEDGQRQPARVHPLGRRHLADAAADRRAGRA